jgi:hypothetical protein
MSEEELSELNSRIELSGRDKQDYLIKSTLFQAIVVIGNRVQFERLKSELVEIAGYLKHLESNASLDLNKLASLRTAVEIITGFTDAQKPWDDTGMTAAPKTTETADNGETREIKNRW